MKSILKKAWKENWKLFRLVAVIITIGLSQKYFFDSKPQIFTIGTCIDSEAPVRGGVIVVFKYSFKGKEYIERNGRGKYSYQIGKRYFVSIPEGYPAWGLLMLDKPVPDSIKSAPLEGWKELPILVDPEKP